MCLLLGAEGLQLIQVALPLAKYGAAEGFLWGLILEPEVGVAAPWGSFHLDLDVSKERIECRTACGFWTGVHADGPYSERSILTWPWHECSSDDSYMLGVRWPAKVRKLSSILVW